MRIFLFSLDRYADTAVTFMVTTKTTRNQFSEEVLDAANDRYRVRIELHNKFYHQVSNKI